MALARAVILYSRVGGGHLAAARALAAELEATGRCYTRIADAYLECGRFPVTLFPAAYARLARHHPLLWSLIYRSSSRDLKAEVLIGPFLKNGFRRLLRQERPDVVISALPVINGLLAATAKQANARMEVVLTDWHSVHPLWVARGVEHYTAPTDSARSDCLRYGARPETVDVVGIPVRREFATNPSPDHARHAVLADLRLDPRRLTVLAMVGAEGSPGALRNIARLAASDIDAQLVVVCGRNADLRQHVERLPTRLALRALGFVDRMADLMHASDVLVTKAGGLTLAEAFCCHLPVVIHDLLPGQEAGNLEYLLAYGAVVYAPRPPALVQVVSELVAYPARREQLAECGARLARPDASRQIAENVLRRLDTARA